MGTITAETSEAQQPGNQDTSDTTVFPEEEKALCVGDGDAGGACEVTADCNAPMVCSNNVCIGPSDVSYTCDPIENINCDREGETCVNGLCIPTPGACETLDECPLGFVCADKKCTPERDGAACSDPGAGPSLVGTYQTQSVLHLRDGLPDVVDKILDVAEDARDIVEGKLDLGLSSAVDFIIGSLVAGIIRQYVPKYGIDIITMLGNLSDILDDMKVDGVMTLKGQACDGNYRGTHEWKWVTFEYQGREMKVAPNDLPGVDNVVPEAFSARYHCGDLLIDKHRIKNSMGGLVRWLLDTAANAVTGKKDLEGALKEIIDCRAVGSAVGQACTYCFAAGPVATAACDVAVMVGVSKATEAIDKAAVKMSLIKLKAVVPVNQDGTMNEGIWYGSLVGGDFKGTLKAAKQ